MKYEGPELTVLTPAINAIQNSKQQGGIDGHDVPVAYEDWE